MDAEIRDDRIAQRRETQQRARRYLQDNNCLWVLTQLIDHGPQTQHTLYLKKAEEDRGNVESPPLHVFLDLHALWLTKKI
jgi:hypothetical protein